LVRPKYGGNIGATARAMANFGLTDLRIVRGPEPPDPQEAYNMAAGARELLAGATWVDTTADAVAGATAVVACTARPRRWKSWEVLDPQPACELLADRQEATCLMFGQEDHGLSRDDLSFATHLCSIPTAGSHSSLNLSQAVLLMGWEWAKAGARPRRRPTPRGGRVARATIDHVNRAVDQAGDLLESIEFFKRRGRAQTLAQLRHTMVEADLTLKDVQFLRGIVNKLQWWVRHGPRNEPDT
jgi:tRNA/rRNA methyltransferase